VTGATQGIELHRKSERWDIRHMSEFDDLMSKFYSGQGKPDTESLDELIREFGVSPNDTERIRSMLNDLGYTDDQLGDVNEMAKVAQGFLASMPDETRNQIMNLALQAVSSLQLGEIPPELLRLFGNHNNAFDSLDKSKDEQ
jgi:Ca2+-binding EF-hand superfamily protein